MATSYWERDLLNSGSDLLIIGAGIVGLSTALFYKEKNPDAIVKVLDAESVGNVATTRSAGFACFGSVTELLSDITHMGRDAVAELVAMRYQGLQQLIDLVHPRKMAYQACGGYEVFRLGEVSAGISEGVIKDLNQLVKDATGLEHTYDFTPIDIGATIDSLVIVNKHEGLLHPGRLMEALNHACQAKGIILHRSCKIDRILNRDHFVLTSKGIGIPYNQLAICTNALAARLLPEVDVVPAANVVHLYHEPAIAKMLPGGMHMDEGYLYFRAVDQDHFLFGGGRHHFPFTGFPLSDSDRQEVSTYLDQEVWGLWPTYQPKLKYSWTGYLGVGPNRKPIIQSVGADVYCAVRMGGMGIAIGTGVGKALAELIG